MTFEIRYLDNHFEKEFKEFNTLSNNSLFYHTDKYIDFLESVLEKCEYKCLMALDNQKIVASMPFFVKKSPIGAVVNSLPFFGSHGSIISLPGVSDEIKWALLTEFDEFCKLNQVLSSTIIENFRDPIHHLLERTNYSYREQRNGGITKLTKISENNDIEETLMLKFHSKTRNAIRKSLKSKVSIKIETSEEVLNELYLMHVENMEAKNGKTKPKVFFSEISKHFEKNHDYKIFTARDTDGTLIAALLLFYCKDFVEYFVPAIRYEYRSDQVMSGLIFSAMKNALIEGTEINWNWGGTWDGQETLRKFKSKWGSEEFVYYYYTKIYGDAEKIRNMKISELEDLFEFFYVMPYRELK